MWNNIKYLDMRLVKWKMRFFTFSGCEKLLDKLSIYRSMHGINLETICGPLNSPNRLGTSNNRLMGSKIEGLDIE